MHKTIEPTILYFGTPVALISTLNPDGSPNLAPLCGRVLRDFSANLRLTAFTAEIAELWQWSPRKWTCMSDAMLQNLRELLPLRY
jgi:hypothetical protein